MAEFALDLAAFAAKAKAAPVDDDKPLTREDFVRLAATGSY